MAFTGIDDIAKGLIAGRKTFFNKITASSLAGVLQSLWTTTGSPAAGAIPVAAAICTSALAGALPLHARTGGQERIIAFLEAYCQNAFNSLEIEDRLLHMGGLNGTLTTAQTVGLDASLTGNNLVQRVGSTDYSDLEWFLEWYATTGVTVSTPTLAVTYNDNAIGTATIINPLTGAGILPASVTAGRRYQIFGAKPIKSIQSATLSASTGTAGNFGVTCRRRLMEIDTVTAFGRVVKDFASGGSPLIYDEACLAFSCLPVTTSTGAWSGSIKQAVN